MTIEQCKSTDDARVHIFKTLADPARLQIIRTLQGSNTEPSCGEVGELYEASKSNPSYHFRTLREAGLILVRKEAQTKYIQINHDTFSMFIPGFLDSCNPFFYSLLFNSYLTNEVSDVSNTLLGGTTVEEISYRLVFRDHVRHRYRYVSDQPTSPLTATDLPY